MPLNLPALQAAIYAAFRKQAVKPGPNKVGVEMQLAMDISLAIDTYVRSGTVLTATLDINLGRGIGFSAPHPYVVPVFTINTGVGIGGGLGKVI